MSLPVQVPTVGIANATEAAKVTNTLTSLSGWANGNIPATDLSPTAGILRSQMAGGFGNLAWTAPGVSVAGVDGRFYFMVPGTTVTLPAPTANTTIGVIASGAVTAASPVTVTAPGAARINGLGVVGVVSIVLGAPLAAVVLLADGANWEIVSGQRDTGWVTLALTANFVAAAGYYVPAARAQGDTVRFRGAIANISGSTAAGSTVATYTGIPAPVGSLVAPAYGLIAPGFVSLGSGVVQPSSLANAANLYLDGLSYSL